MKVGGQILWNVTPICETSQIFCLMAKTPYERRLGQPCKGPVIPFGSLVEYHPITAKDQSRIHQFGKSFTWIVPRIRSLRGENLERWRTDCRPWGVGDDGRIGNLLEKTQCERGDISQTKRIYFSNRRWTNQNPWRRSGTENIHLDTAATNSLPHDSLPVAGEAITDFWSMSGSFIYRHHVEPRVKLYSPREESFLFHWNTLT